MASYFTTVEVRDGKYIGILYDTNTNTKLYETQGYPSQSVAVKEINNYLKSNKPPSTQAKPYNPTTPIVNTVIRQTTPSKRSCCGG